jgi:hypothetical protein
METKKVVVTQVIEVKYDPSKFTEEFMSDFRQYMFSHFNSVDDHIKYLATLYARGFLENEWEFYGDLEENMKIQLNIENIEAELENDDSID